MAQEFGPKFIKQAIETIEKQAVDRMDKIAITTHSRLVTATPVDLGVARASWNFTLNKPSRKVPATPSSGTLAAPPSRPDKKAKTLDDSYFLTNAAPHIVPLNEGHSQQAPSNFVEREIRQAKKDVEQSEL